MTNLRTYQLDLVERVRSEYRAGTRAVVMQLGTGGGKTHTASHLIASAVERGRRVVFAAHLDALIDDTSERLDAAGIAHGIVQGGRPTNAGAAVQVASLATLGVAVHVVRSVENACRDAIGRCLLTSEGMKS